MGGCVAPNCRNKDRKGFRMFRFPRDAIRRQKWKDNVRRENWEPTNESRLCEVHFEECQYEQRRLDGLKKLKPNAVPTIFVGSYPPQNRNKSGIQNIQNIKIESNFLVNEGCGNVNCSFTNPKEKEKLRLLEVENYHLKRKLEESNALLRKFLNNDQILAVSGQNENWSDETIIKALKFRFALNVYGYEYLRQTNYPLPTFSTLSKKISEFEVDFSIFEDILQALKYKVETMPSADRYCLLSLNTMEIDEQLSLDHDTQKFYGYVTLDSKKEPFDHQIHVLGNHILVVVCRGLKQNWKQIIAAHVTEKSIDAGTLKIFLDECIRLVEETGLRVIALSCNTKQNNQSVWDQYCCCVKEDGIRCNSFQSNNHDIFIIPDVYHILHNLKLAMLTSTIQLPEEFVKCERLPTTDVSGKFVLDMWNAEFGANKEISSLCHLNKSDLDPDNCKEMNVASVMRFFSLKTVAGLELGAHMEVLPQEVLTTTKFIRVVENWFRILTSKTRKTSITRCNKIMKYEFLYKIIDLFQSARIGGSWNLLNIEVIMATLSVCDIGDFLLENNFDFLFTHRLTSECTENVFSQMRKEGGVMPCAFICLQVLRSITLSQFSCDLKRSSYSNKSDEFLLSLLSDGDDYSETNVVDCVAPTKNCIELPNTALETFRLDNNSLLESLINTFDLNILNRVEDIITKIILESCCKSCNNFLMNSSKNDVIFTFYKNFVDLVGLKSPCSQLIELIVNCEIYYNKFRNFILHSSVDVLIYKLFNELNIDFPICCNMKLELIGNFFKIRTFVVVHSSKKPLKRKIVPSSTTTKKTKK